MNARKIHFVFENRQLEGVEGEPIAKALFRAGIRTLSHSVKYKRARSLHCARGRCVMCHMEVDGVPGVPTCIAPLREGMLVRREDFRPFFAPLLISAVRIFPFSAGFYYRMFTRPAFLRRLFLGSLRRMAGVGRVASNARPRRKPHRPGTLSAPPLEQTYDVVVVGAGLSGMAASLAAAEKGASVLLVDEYAVPGGHAIGAQADDDLVSTRDRYADRVIEHRSIRFCARTTAQAFYHPNTLLLGPGGALGPATFAGGTPTTAGDDHTLGGVMKRVTAATFVFATGGYDIVPLFENNDVPGIFGPRAIRLLLERDRLVPGKVAVVYGNGGTLREVVDLLGRHNIEVAGIVDAGNGSLEVADATQHIERGAIKRTHGGDWLSSVTVTAGDKQTRISCDLLCTAFVGQGAYELPYQAGFRFEMSGDIDENKVMLPVENSLQCGSEATCYVIGELAGHRSWREKVSAGEEAGRSATESLKT